MADLGEGGGWCRELGFTGGHCLPIGDGWQVVSAAVWHVCPCMVHCPFLQECTFAPKVGRPPESHRHRTNVPVDERLYRHGEGKWEALERAKAAQESAQLADCTFAPQVGPSCCGCVQLLLQWGACAAASFSPPLLNALLTNSPLHIVCSSTSRSGICGGNTSRFTSAWGRSRSGGAQSWRSCECSRCEG